MDKRTSSHLAELLSSDPAYVDQEKRDRVVREIMIAYGLAVPPVGLEKDIQQANASQRKSRSQSF